MRILYIILLMLLVPVVFAATDYRSEKQELVFEKTFAMLRRDESSAATINALDTTKGYIKLTSTVTTINGAIAPTSPVSRMIIITNHTGGDVTISDQSVSASAANRFALSDGNLEIPDKSSATFIYDHGLSRWVGAGGGGGGVAFTAVAPIDYDTITKQLTCDVASGSQPGCLASSDFTNFDATYDDVNLASSSHINGRLARWDATGLTGGVWTGSVSGNASTASALAANPADCSGEEWALGIGADGTAVCSRVHQGVKNYVINPGAEVNASTGITATNTTVTRNTTNPLFDSADFSFTIDSASDVVEWSLDAFDQELKNAVCEVSGSFATDANGENVQVQLYRNSSVVGSKSLWTTTSSNPQEFGIYAPCGDLTSATTLRVVGTAATATAVKIDQLQVTKIRGLSRSQIGGTWVGSITVTNCSAGWDTSSTSYADFATQSGCSYTVANGSSEVSAPLTNIPGLTLNQYADSVYRFEAVGSIEQGNTSSDPAYFQFFDGTTQSFEQNTMSVGTSASSAHPVIVGTIQPSTSSTVQLRIRGKVASGANAYIRANSGNFLTINVYRFPRDSAISTVASKTGDYDWTSYTPVFEGFGTPTGVQFFHKRIGDTLYVRGSFVAGTVSATPGTIGIPSGLAIDTTKIASTRSNVALLSLMTQEATNALSTSNNGVVFFDGSSTGKVFLTNAANGTNLFTKPNASSVFSTGGDISVQEFSVPIKGWTKSAVASSIGAPDFYAGFSLSAAATDNSNTGGVWANASNATWATKTFHGSAVAGTSANHLSFKVPSLPAGAYEVVTNAQVYSASGNVCRFAIYDGSNRNGIVLDSNLASAVDASVLGVGLFRYATPQTNREFSIQLFSGGTSCGVKTADNTAETTFYLKRIGD